MKNNDRFYKDSIHGFTAKCKSRGIAWALIRAKCHELKLEVPTMDKIFIRNEKLEKRRRKK